jgi:CheY-like chemotaxis protein
MNITAMVQALLQYWPGSTVAADRGSKVRRVTYVTDINLRGTMDGWEVAKQARQVTPDFPAVYITAASGGQWPQRAFRKASC